MSLRHIQGTYALDVVATHQRLGDGGLPGALLVRDGLIWKHSCEAVANGHRSVAQDELGLKFWQLDLHQLVVTDAAFADQSGLGLPRFKCEYVVVLLLVRRQDLHNRVEGGRGVVEP